MRCACKGQAFLVLLLGSLMSWSSPSIRLKSNIQICFSNVVGVVRQSLESCAENYFQDRLSRIAHRQKLFNLSVGHGHSDSDAKSRLEVQHGDTDLDIGNLPFKVPSHERLAN